MKPALVFAALFLTLPALAGAQDSPSPVKPDGGSPHIQGSAHDAWAVDSASPYRNLAESIGSNWKGSPKPPRCPNNDWACSQTNQKAGQPKR